MRTEAQELALAILNRVKERGAQINKTRLLKLLYLADIEHYRKHDETLTGFEWRFHLYGPWAAEFDPLLTDLARTDKIEVESWAKDELTGNRILTKAERQLNDLIKDADEYFRILRTVDTWADRPLPDLLDYIYFETEPMVDAVSQAPLSFSLISKDPLKLYRRTASKASPGDLRRMRAKLLERKQQSDSARAKSLAAFRPPIYDEVYSAALGELESEENR